MSIEHDVVFVPGLHDQEPVHKKLVSLLPVVWQGYGMLVHVVYPLWESGETLNDKLARIRNVATDLAKQGKSVSLVGQSAGGSAAGNIFLEDPEQYTAFVNITGRLARGEGSHPSLEFAARDSPAFAESVVRFETAVGKSDRRTRERILTIRPFWDIVVPSITVGVLGATNLIAPFPDHVVGGVLIDVLYAKQIAQFLNSVASKTRRY